MSGNPVMKSMGDNFVKVDKISEARYKREMRAQLRKVLSETAPDVDLKYLFSDVIPSVLDSIGVLLKAVESEGERKLENQRQIRRLPATLERQDVNPLHFMAAHLMRHNPKYLPPKEKLVVQTEVEISDDEREEIKDTWRLVTEGRDDISQEDLRAILRGHGDDYAEASVRRFLTQLDIDPDRTGTLEFDDYVKAVVYVRHQMPTHLQSRQEQRKSTLMTKFHISSAELKYLEQQFKRYDTDNSGTVSLDEMIEVFHALHEEFPSEAIADLFHRVDLNKDGRMDFQEFITTQVESQDVAPIVKNELTKEPNADKENALAEIRELKASFDAMDKDKSGSISVSEIRQVMKETGFTDITDEQIKAIIAEADPNGNGTIEFMEFVKYSRSHRADQKRPGA